MKYNNRDALNDILVRRLLLLGMVDARKEKVYDQIYEELEELAMRDENIANAFSAWEKLSRSKEDVLAHESRIKYILDEEAKLEDVKYMAEKKGREEGQREITELTAERIKEIASM